MAATAQPRIKTVDLAQPGKQLIVREALPGDLWWAGRKPIEVDTKALAAADRINEEFDLSLDRIKLGAIIRDSYRTNS